MDNYKINDEEVNNVLKRLKGSASPGPNGVHGFCFKHGGDFIKDALIDCFNQSLEMELSSKMTKEA